MIGFRSPLPRSPSRGVPCPLHPCFVRYSDVFRGIGVRVERHRQKNLQSCPKFWISLPRGERGPFSLYVRLETITNTYRHSAKMVGHKVGLQAASTVSRSIRTRPTHIYPSLLQHGCTVRVAPTALPFYTHTLSRQFLTLPNLLGQGNNNTPRQFKETVILPYVH